MFSTSDVEIVFRFVNPIERFKLYYNGEECVPDANDEYTFRKQIQFPETIKFEVKGKDPHGADTQVDAQGNILWDRYIIIKRCSVDGVVPNLNFVQRWARIHPGTQIKDFRPSNQIVFSNYFGFNGVVEIEFEGSNAVEWLFRTQQYKADDWQKNYDYE